MLGEEIPNLYEVEEHQRDLSESFQTRKNTILSSHGRPPWYGENGLPLSNAFVIGIAGGSASGKTYVARQIVKSLGSTPTVVIMSQDSFYKRHTEEEIALAHANHFDFDHPDAIDMDMFAAVRTVTSHESDLRHECDGLSVSRRPQGMSTDEYANLFLQRTPATRPVQVSLRRCNHHRPVSLSSCPSSLIPLVAEGIMTLHDPKLRALYDLKIFVQCDSDIMLTRRILRDVKERGRSMEGVLEQYLRYVKPAFDNFVLPTAQHADIIVPGSNNAVAIQLITTHIRSQMNERARHFRRNISYRPVDKCLNSPSGNPEDSTLILLPQTLQLQGIYTVLRDEKTSRQDFIFFVDRLATLLIEKAMELLPYRTKVVTTPTDTECSGKELDVKHICGVSILRSGGPLEKGLQRVLSDVAIGSLLVQTDGKTGEPLLLHVMLPKCIRERHLAVDTWVFLLDAQISTGASAFMAIRTLLDHGVQEDHIIFVTFLVARTGGIHVLQSAFPKVRIICGAIDSGLREAWIEQYHSEGEGQHGNTRKVWIVEPGMGQIGDRYYL